MSVDELIRKLAALGSVGDMDVRVLLPDDDEAYDIAGVWTEQESSSVFLILED